jgi:hypothetical protein
MMGRELGNDFGITHHRSFSIHFAPSAAEWVLFLSGQDVLTRCTTPVSLSGSWNHRQQVPAGPLS